MFLQQHNKFSKYFTWSQVYAANCKGKKYLWEKQTWKSLVLKQPRARMQQFPNIPWKVPHKKMQHSLLLTAMQWGIAGQLWEAHISAIQDLATFLQCRNS